MNRRVLLFLLLLVITPVVRADEKLQGIACRSVHLGYPAPVSVAFYNEVTIEQSAAGTYFMVCGWDKGYFGMQELGNGKKLVLFSYGWLDSMLCSGDRHASKQTSKQTGKQIAPLHRVRAGSSQGGCSGSPPQCYHTFYMHTYTQAHSIDAHPHTRTNNDFS